MRPTVVPKALGAALAAVVGVYAGQAAQFRRQAGTVTEVADPAPPGTAAFSRWMEAACSAPLRPGNRVQVLRNGDEIIASMLDAVAGAEHTIDFCNYIFWKGETATTFAEALSERARAGVAVNVMLDAYGSAKIERDLIPAMERAGVTFSWFRVPHWYKAHQFNNRMHRRILVVDGRVGFTGGFGVADVWMGDAKGPEQWRDTHLRIEGPAVRDVLGAFMENWNEATHHLLSGHHLPKIEPFEDGVSVQVARSSPGHGAATAETLMLAALFGAQHRVWVTTAYFAPRRAVIDALAGAARRGVEVRLLVNGSCIDKELARRAGQRSYATLLEAGVRIFEYERTMMHAKVVVVDDGWANVGTSNWDNRSMALQEELNCSIADESMAAELEKHFLSDFDGAEEIDLERWRARSVASRTYEWAAEAMRQSL